MSIPTKNTLLFNGAAFLLIGASLAYVARATLLSDSIPPCSERFSNGVQMALENAGQPLGAADIQARAGGSDWGLLDRAKVVKIAAGPSKIALQLDLTGSKADDRDDSNGREGVGFAWAPRKMKSAEIACLAYSVFLPLGFEYGGGGRLPGLMGISKSEEGEEEGARFSTRFAWDENGTGQIFAETPVYGRGRLIGGASGFEIPRGRWVSLEQEVELNTPGVADGTLRVWIDGSLVLDASVPYRQKLGAITGVLSEAVATNKDVSPKAKDQKISISPFVVYWAPAQ